jgi:anti-sigma B factor antagonist
MMKVSVDERCGVHVVLLGGSMTGGDESNWVLEVTKLLDKSNAKIVLDLSGVSYVSSAGLGDLVRVTALANTQHAKLSLAALSPFVDGVLKATRLDRFFDIVPDVDMAINRMNQT